MLVREEMRIAALARAVIDGGARAEDVPRASREVLRLAGQRGAEEGLVNLARDPSEPAIVRATALDVLRRYGPASLPVSVAGTRDPDPAVRTAAVASLERVPPDERVSLVAPLLGDPVRAVRIEAARVLSSVPSQSARCLAAPGGRAGRRGVHRRAERRPRPAGSTPEPGGAVREPGQARARGGTLPAALRLDPDFTPARLNLARLLNELGRNPDAEHVLRDGIARVPDEGELHYSLGLLLGEDERLPEAAAALGRAADLMPARARVRYNEALALQRLGRRADAEAAFVKAQNTDPEDPDVAYALAVLYAQQSDWSRARDAAARLAALSPGNPQVQELIDRI